MKRILSSGLAFIWAACDSVYGEDHSLRFQLERKIKAYVVVVSVKDYINAGFTPYRVSEILVSLPQKSWVRMSVGDRSKGPRMYD